MLFVGCEVVFCVVFWLFGLVVVEVDSVVLVVMIVCSVVVSCIVLVFLSGII